MKYLTLSLILTLLSCTFSNEKKKNTSQHLSVTESEIYEVVNTVLADEDKNFKTSPFKYLLDKDYSEEFFSKRDSIIIFESDTIFSKKDKLFLQKQVIDYKDFRFSRDSIKSKIVISSDTIKKMLNGRPPGNNFFTAYELRFGEEMFYTIGLPIFSIDKKTVVVKIEGFGSGKTLIYKKVKNKWVYYSCCLRWIS